MPLPPCLRVFQINPVLCSSKWLTKESLRKMFGGKEGKIKCRKIEMVGGQQRLERLKRRVAGKLGTLFKIGGVLKC